MKKNPCHFVQENVFPVLNVGNFETTDKPSATKQLEHRQNNPVRKMEPC
jgi:hypothetical protein